MKSTLLKLFVALAVVAALLSLNSCSNNKKANDETHESVNDMVDETEITSDEETDELTYGDTEARSGKNWPTMLPANFPKFEKGTIVTAQESKVGGNTSATIEISGVDGDDVKEYVKKLEKFGFKKQVYSEDDEDMGGVLSKGGDNLTIAWDGEEKLFDLVYTGSGK